MFAVFRLQCLPACAASLSHTETARCKVRKHWTGIRFWEFISQRERDLTSKKLFSRPIRHSESERPRVQVMIDKSVRCADGMWSGMLQLHRLASSHPEKRVKWSWWWTLRRALTVDAFQSRKFRFYFLLHFSILFCFFFLSSFSKLCRCMRAVARVQRSNNA